MLADARRSEGQGVFRDGGAVEARLIDQGEERAVGGQEVMQGLSHQVRGASPEQLLGGGVDVEDGPIRIDHRHGRGQGAEHRLAVDARPVGARQSDDRLGHQAARRSQRAA